MLRLPTFDFERFRLSNYHVHHNILIIALIAWYETGSVQSSSLNPGRYKLRVWGAQGGFIHNSTYNRGAYTEGILKLKFSTKLRIYVGQQGQCNTSVINSVFYGGGSNSQGWSHSKSCTGGGSTFITFENNISNIIIVSGSGGGSGYYAYTDGTVESFGGYGGLIAGNGAGSGFGTGATISSARNGGFYPGTSASLSCLAENGEKLTGGNSCSTSEASAGGGGSGYFGGGGGADLGGGGGGSSFASDILENIKYLNGNENMTEPIGTTNIGHVGNGFVIIEHFFNGVEIKYRTYNTDFIQIGDDVNPAISISYEGELSIPREIESKTVIKLCNNSFSNCNLTKIILPDSIEIIGSKCFSNSSIESVEFPLSLTEISSAVFSNSKIRYVSFSQCSYLEIIGDSIFANSLLENIILPPNLIEIPPWSFTTCLYLPNITIPRNVAKIRMAAFVDCVNLSLFISESPNFVVFNGALYDKLFTTLYAFPSKYYYTDIVPTVKFVASSRGFSGCSFTEFTLKNRLEGVDMFLFRSCFNLKKIDLRCGVFKTLSYSAFTGCYNLFELKLPKTIEEFSYLLFTMTGKLKSLTLPDNLKKIHTRAFESSSLTDINYCGLFNVPYKIPSSYNVHVTQFYQGGSLFAGKTISDRNFVCEAIYCTNSYVMLPVIKTIPHNIRCYQFSFNLILLSQVFISI